MTSRLKKQLNNLGVDPSSSKLTESFCLIGTPLPPLEKTRDANEFLPAWKQDVRDEQGRRRLHGAFTGGFSAGYFNTVGSKEGWTPSTFKSSRSSRTANKGARPEDFMDEEDLAEMRDSKKMVDTTEEMDLLGGTQAELHKRSGGISTDENDPIANALANLLPSPSDSVGAQLLKKMGWRPGQGVGPRVTYAQLRAQDRKSFSLPASAVPSAEKGDEEDEDDEARKHTYAPRDTQVIRFQPKANAHGLGFVPGAGLTDLVDGGSGQRDASHVISAGFGLGALNDAEDDDIDVYSTSEFQPSRRLAYEDDSAGAERLTLGSSRQDRKPLAPRPNAPIQGSTGGDTFHDGRPVLSGFVLAEKPLVEDVWFKIPDVPKGWKPNPQSVWSSAPPPESASMPLPPPGTFGRPDTIRFKGEGLTAAEQRGAKLGETGLVNQAPRSVFDYLSEKDRERLRGVGTSSPSVDPSSSSSDAAPPPPPPLTLTIPTLDGPIAQAALRGFQPFQTDPFKHARYTKYLTSQAYGSNSPSYSPPPSLKEGQKIDEFNKEMEDYAKAAMIFKPMSGAMANRFTSAAIVDTGPKIVEGLFTPVQGESLVKADEEKRKDENEVKVEETPKENAARMGMYGKLTREEKSWMPAKLLSKRFGVKSPAGAAPTEGNADEGGSSSAAGAGAGQPSSSWDIATAAIGLPSQSGSTSASSSSATPANGSGSASSSGRPKDITNIGLGEDENQGRDTLTYERPGMDIFKAIFASDDEDSDDDNDDKMDLDTKTASSSTSALPLPSTTPTPTTTVPPTAGKPLVTPEVVEEVIEGPVDLASFRPQFVSKSQRTKTISTSSDTTKSSSKKKKDKEKEKEKSKSKVSFGMDDEDGEGLSIVVDKKKSKKGKKRAREKDGGGGGDEERREKKRASRAERRDEDEEMEWVEKPLGVPDVPTMTQTENQEQIGSGTTSTGVADLSLAISGSAGPGRGRMKASDFM